MRFAKDHPFAIVHGAVTIGLVVSFLSLRNNQAKLFGDSRRYAEDLCRQERMASIWSPLDGMVISPFEGTTETGVKGLALSYDVVSFGSRLAKIRGEVTNTTSIPLFGKLTVRAMSAPPDSVYSNEKLGSFRCRYRTFGHDTVSVSLLAHTSAPFQIVIAIPAGTDTTDIFWGASLSPFLVRDVQRYVP